MGEVREREERERYMRSLWVVKYEIVQPQHRLRECSQKQGLHVRCGEGNRGWTSCSNMLDCAYLVPLFIFLNWPKSGSRLPPLIYFVTLVSRPPLIYLPALIPSCRSHHVEEGAAFSALCGHCSCCSFTGHCSHVRGSVAAGRGPLGLASLSSWVEKS